MAGDAETVIADDTRLFRRVPPRENEGWVRDENRDCIRLSSAVFSPKSMSVLLGDRMELEGRAPHDALTKYPDHFLVAITAGDARSQEQEVLRTPVEEEPAHGDVVGKKTRGRRRALCAAAEWLRGPDDLCEDERVAA